MDWVSWVTNSSLATQLLSYPDTQGFIQFSVASPSGLEVRVRKGHTAIPAVSAAQTTNADTVSASGLTRACPRSACQMQHEEERRVTASRDDDQTRAASILDATPPQQQGDHRQHLERVQSDEVRHAKIAMLDAPTGARQTGPPSGAPTVCAPMIVAWRVATI